MSEPDALDQLIKALIYALRQLDKDYEDGRLSKRQTYIRLLSILATASTLLLEPPDPALRELADSIKTGRAITN